MRSGLYAHSGARAELRGELRPCRRRPAGRTAARACQRESVHDTTEAVSRNPTIPLISLNHLYFDAVERHRKPDAFRLKHDGRWVDVSHADFARQVERVSLGLLSLGVSPGDRVGILAENRIEWAVADLAILCARGVTVPIFPTLPPHQMEFQLKNSGMKILFVSTANQFEKVAKIRDSLRGLVHIILFEPPVHEAPHTITLGGLMTRGDDFGRTAPTRHRELALAAKSEDLATIIYTSGTTGVPKGVMLSHGNILSNVKTMAEILDFGPRDICLSFLPLTHILERMGGQFAMLHRGVTIAYAESVEMVPANLPEVRPTMLIGVPRLYEKAYSRVMAMVEKMPGPRQKLFQWALAIGWKAAERRLAGRSVDPATAIQCTLAERLVWKKVQARFGGRIRLAITGGAPLPLPVARFFHACGINILEGYGLTETSPVIAVNTKPHTRLGTVGKPIPGIQVRIAEDGEILTRGQHVMLGYWRDELATREVIDADGWFHTGDIGELDRDGYLSITDRKKDIIISATGKNISPAPIENMIKQSPFIAEAIMIADQRKFPTALIVPDFAALRAEAERMGIDNGNDVDLCRDPRMIARIKAEVDQVSRDLAAFERIKRIALIDHELSVAGGELTPTLKLKRKAISEKFKAVIDAMYEGKLPDD